MDSGWRGPSGASAGGGGGPAPLASALTLPSWPCPQISDAVYRMVYEQAKASFEAVLAKLQQARPAMEAVIRTDMDQVITSKEHLASKIRGRLASALPGQLRQGSGGPAALSMGPLCVAICENSMTMGALPRPESSPVALQVAPADSGSARS